MKKSPATDPYCLSIRTGEKCGPALFGPAMSGQRVWGGKHQNSARRWRINHRTRVDADSDAVVFVLWCVTLSSPLGSFSSVTPSSSIRWFMGCILAVDFYLVQLFIAIALALQMLKGC